MMLHRRARWCAQPPAVPFIEHVQLHRHSRRASEQSQVDRSRAADERADRRDGRLRVGKILARVRHAVRGGTTSLRRDLFALRTAIPRSHGSTASRSDRGHSTGHRDRSDESGAYVPLHRRDDDRAQRSLEAPFRACRATLLSSLRAARAPRYGADDLLIARGASGAGRLELGASAHHVPSERAAQLCGKRGRQVARGAGLYAHLRACCKASGRAGRA